MEKLTFGGFLGRLIAAFVLVFATFNPSGHSYLHWVVQQFPHLTAAQAVVGIVLIIVWIVFAVATLRSIGRVGVILIAMLFAAMTWLAISMGWLSMGSKQAIGWIALSALAVTLAVGTSWSFVNQRLTGQVAVDDKDGR